MKFTCIQENGLFSPSLKAINKDRKCFLDIITDFRISGKVVELYKITIYACEYIKIKEVNKNRARNKFHGM